MKFSLQDIQQAESAVKTGADYPKLVQAFKEVGIVAYDFIISEGVTKYYGANNHTVTTAPSNIKIAPKELGNQQEVKGALKKHQKGKTSFAEFCHEVAEAGVWTWRSDLERMIVEYKDKQGKVLVSEAIPYIK